MKAEIITVGTELTTGSTLNTNSMFIANRLIESGIETFYHVSVDDDYKRLEEVLDIAIRRSDLIITSGGLGPTEDDFTKEIVAKHLRRKLILDEDMKSEIIKRFNGNDIPESNYKQAHKIEGSEFIPNSVGTAPGTILNYNGRCIILLPGPPRELEPMFNKDLISRIKNRNYYIIRRSINLTGIGESSVEMKMKDILHLYKDIEIATFGKMKSVEIRLIGRGEDKVLLDRKIKKILKILSERFKDYVYAYDNKPIEEIAYEELRKRDLKISFAESCTGGLISGKLARVAGASKVFYASKVVYTDEAKQALLNVGESSLREHTAISEEVAREMLEGILADENTDLGLSVTGLVGPDSDSSKKPVGLVYMAYGNRDMVEVKEYNLKGTRESIQDRLVETAFFNIRDFLVKNY